MSSWFIDLIGITAGVCTTLAILPQIILSWKTKKVKDLSLPFCLIILSGVSLWTVYGILKVDWPIIIANGISSLLYTSLLYIIIRYRKR